MKTTTKTKFTARDLEQAAAAKRCGYEREIRQVNHNTWLWANGDGSLGFMCIPDREVES